MKEGVGLNFDYPKSRPWGKDLEANRFGGGNAHRGVSNLDNMY